MSSLILLHFFWSPRVLLVERSFDSESGQLYNHAIFYTIAVHCTEFPIPEAHLEMAGHTDPAINVAGNGWKYGSIH